MNFLHTTILAMCLTPLFVVAADLQFSGNSLRVLEAEVPAATGLEKLYVAYNLNNVTISFQSSSPVRCYKFSNLGGGFAEEITDVSQVGDRWSISNVEGDCGYIFEADGRQHCYWIVNYSAHRMTLHGVSPSPTQDCDASMLTVDGEGGPIHYFTVLGQQRTLSRDIEVTYQTLEWDSSRKEFVQKEQSVTFEYLTDELRVTPASLCQTIFTVSGDRFLKEWNWGLEVSTPAVAPTAVEAHTQATRTNSGDDSKSNIIKMEDAGALGGSAPSTIEFQAWVSDAVAHTEWQFSRLPDFSNLENRVFTQDLTYDFVEEGTFYVRFIASNSDGTCESIGETYTIAIGASDLRIPNAFSPNDDGVNDEWKVAYRSLLSFECWIFDRYGNQIKHLTSPEQGWDGKRGGKLVPPGVYFYVIQATGADGKKYKKSGDINILRSEAVPKE